MTKTPIETERKFLIKYPDTKLLAAYEGVRIKNMEQTYLVAEDNKSARVRRIVENGSVSYVKTVKERISALSAYEAEVDISEEQYEQELTRADTGKRTIKKTRFCIPYADHVVEIDVYPFWSDRAIMEIELGDEEEKFEIPSFVEIIKEVSADTRYKNSSLAKIIPIEDI